MQYDNRVWLILRWSTETRKTHIDLDVKVSELQRNFIGGRYHPIFIVDKRFCNSYYFHQDRKRQDIYYRNEYIYSIV